MSTSYPQRRRIVMAVILGLLLVALGAMSASAAPYPTPYLNGFENAADVTPNPDTSGTDTFYGVTRVASGTNGVASADGSWHASAPLDTAAGGNMFNRLGGYSYTFPPGGYTVSIDMYLDTAVAGDTNKRLDWSVASSNATSGHRRDFIFHVGGNNAGGYYVSVSNNAPGWPGNPANNPIQISTTGWYTFKHLFRDNAGVLAVDMQVLDAGGTVLNTWTLTNPTDTINVNVGGNRYAWLVTNDYDQLPLDNVTRSGSCSTTCYADAVNGNDANDGITPATAKKTIQAAIDAVQPGGTVRVLPGDYSETASNRYVLGSNGPHVFGLFIDKDDVTIQGVTAVDAPITDPAATEARVETNSTANFGPDGVFVQGDGVTIAGLEIGTNCCGQNKTFEIIGDAFTLKDSYVNDPQGSVYFNDWQFDTGSNTSHVQSYTIDNNDFASGISIDLTSGAGLSGPVAGRQITDNEFTLSAGEYWPVISFNGSGTGVEWFVQSVGGAVITGNTFHNVDNGAEQWIRARGDYDNSQFDWESYWNDNTYDNAVMFGANPPAVPGEWSYSSGSYVFNHVRRIGAKIQLEVDHATAGDTVLVNEGMYVEQVNVTKSLTLLGEDGRDVTTIKAPANLPSNTATPQQSYIVNIAGAGVNVEMSGFTVSGPGPSGCGSIGTGILVRDAAYADIHDNKIIDVRDTGNSGCQNGNAIVVGRMAWSTTGTADITDNVISGYQKTGILVDHTGSSATIEGNSISGDGPVNYIAENGIQVSRGATAEINDNTISGHSYTPYTATSAGILLYQGGTVNSDGNTLSENQININVIDTSGTHKNNIISATTAGTGSPGFWGIVVDSPPPGRQPSPFGGVTDAPGQNNVTPKPPALVQTVVLTGNELISDGSAGGVGIEADAGYGALDIDLTATKNLIHDWQYGVVIYECVGSCSGSQFVNVDVNFNSIVGNTDVGLYAGTAANVTDGTCNWWGDGSGPSGEGPGSGDAVSTLVDFAPWLFSDDLDGDCYTGGTITVIKQTIPDGDPTEFTFNPSWSTTDFMLSDGESETSPTLPNGNYSVVEVNALGWDLTSATCTDGVTTVAPNAIPVSADDAWTCTFTNNYDEEGDGLLYIAPNKNNGVVGGVPYMDEDIVVNLLGTNQWAMYFDGSDMGITKNLTDFTFTPDNCMLMTFNGNQNVPGVGLVKPQDLVKFCPTSTGTTTAGTFSMYFDGSDVGLASAGEIIDAVEVLPNGDLVISTKGSSNIPQPPAAPVKGKKSDLLIFHGTQYGVDTMGSWDIYLANQLVSGLKKENIISLYMDPGLDKYISFWDKYKNVGGLSGDANDILIIHPDYTVTKFWEGSDWGYTGRVHGLHIVPEP